MVVEFIKDYKTCHKAGSRFDAQPHFAAMLIEAGFAKAILGPPRNKMIEAAEKNKYLMEVKNAL